MVSGAVGRAMWDDETSELFSALSSSDSRVLLVSFRLFELCKDSPTTLLSVASVSVRFVPSSSLSIASRYSLRFRVGISEGAISRVCLNALWYPLVKRISRVQRSLGFSGRALVLVLVLSTLVGDKNTYWHLQFKANFHKPITSLI